MEMILNPFLQHFRLVKRHWSKCIGRSLPSLWNKNYRLQRYPHVCDIYSLTRALYACKNDVYIVCVWIAFAAFQFLRFPFLFFLFFFHAFSPHLRLLFMYGTWTVAATFDHFFVNSISVHCSWTHKFHFLSIFSLKMGSILLFTYLKIILLQCFQFSVSTK